MTIPSLPQTALADVKSILDHYLNEATPEIADRFLDAMQTALRQIREHPGMGSPRFAQALKLPALRVWPTRGFPYLIFYLDHGENVEIWRILHSARDIPPTLRE